MRGSKEGWEILEQRLSWAMAFGERFGGGVGEGQPAEAAGKKFCNI